MNIYESTVTIDACFYPETACYDREKRSIHSSAHNVRENSSWATDQSTTNDQQSIIEHEPTGGGRPAGITIQHTDHNRHISTSNGHDQMPPQKQSQNGHDVKVDEVLLDHEKDHENSAQNDDDQVEYMTEAPTEDQGGASDLAVELSIRHHGTSEGDGPDEDSQECLYQLDFFMDF